MKREEEEGKKMYLVRKLNLDIVDYHNFATAKNYEIVSGSHRFGANQLTP